MKTLFRLKSSVPIWIIKKFRYSFKEMLILILSIKTWKIKFSNNLFIRTWDKTLFYSQNSIRFLCVRKIRITDLKSETKPHNKYVLLQNNLTILFICDMPTNRDRLRVVFGRNPPDAYSSCHSFPVLTPSVNCPYPGFTAEIISMLAGDAHLLLEPVIINSDVGKVNWGKYVSFSTP